MERAKARRTRPTTGTGMGREDVRKYARSASSIRPASFRMLAEPSAEKGNTAFDLLADKIAAFLNRPMPSSATPPARTSQAAPPRSVAVVGLPPADRDRLAA